MQPRRDPGSRRHAARSENAESAGAWPSWFNDGVNGGSRLSPRWRSRAPGPRPQPAVAGVAPFTPVVRSSLSIMSRSTWPSETRWA